MARTKLIISVIVLLSGSQALGVWWWPPSGVEIVPGNPSPSDLVNITLSGLWPNACIPEYSSVSVVGNDIYFDVTEPPQTECDDVIVGWGLTEQVGLLEPGSYSLYARLIDEWGSPGPYTQVAEFSVRPAGDIDMTFRVDLLDYALLAEAWMSEPNDDNWDAACDISEPNDGIIDGRDLGVLGGNWLESVPGIIYEFEICNMEGGESGILEGLRFTVWVEGNYIYFEDMIHANCCPDEIALEMVVDGNVITIREIERLTMPCTCTCDWPVSARLGPFEDGCYLVEVYDVYGVLLGTVQVVIGQGGEGCIEYEIGQCSMGESGASIAEEPVVLRFSVTVEGSNILFEDVMAANCCPERLWLEMVTGDNLIIIYEREYTPSGCWCICDYPVEARFGPFEDGVYTVEVYEDYGGPIGSTTVEIGGG
jgi:hypothetical protein